MITSLADLTTILATGPSQWSLMDPYLTQSQCCQEFLRDLYWAPYFFLSTLTTNLPAVVGNHYTNVNLFADDVLLYHQILITDTMDYAVLQEAITLLEYWSITTHLNFNVSKCKYPPPPFPVHDHFQKERPNSPAKPVVSAWKPSAKGGMLQIPGLTHRRCISLQLVLRPNRSSVCFRGTSMAQYGLATPWLCMPDLGPSPCWRQENSGGHAKFACRMASHQRDSSYQDLYFSCIN